MRKHLLLPGDGMPICHVPAGQTAAGAGNSTNLSFARQPGEAIPANHRLNNRFSATSITGEAPAVTAPIPGRPGQILSTRAVNPASLPPAGKIIARQPVSTGRKQWLRWAMPGPIQGIAAGIFTRCCQPRLVLMRLLPAAARLNNLVHADYSIITLMHQRR